MASLNYNRLLYQVSAGTSKKNKQRLLEQIIDYLRQTEADWKLTPFELLLVLDEAISNAMEHGNLWRKNLKVSVSISRKSSGDLEIAVRDQGLGFESRNLYLMQEETTFINTRGRGIKIIESLCPIHFNDMGNIAFLTILRKS